ncbi:asialoglycoprotein receptor 2-like [Pseudophryne corroboree]|uniref:asialoglycoprotein receptor 2-like n=1 Tax=Pseudophryne corroboree TaxID=495146 RepID=UPI0030816B05
MGWELRKVMELGAEEGDGADEGKRAEEGEGAVAKIDLHVSSELDQLSLTYIELNSSLTQRLGDKEDLIGNMRQSLEKTRQELELVLEEMKDLNGSLLQCHREGKKSMDDKETAEITLSETRSELNQWKQSIKGFCPEDWILVGKKCIWISKDTATWSQSNQDCETRNSNLMIVNSDDPKLQDSLQEKEADYWASPRLRNGKCWTISRRLETDYCYNKKKWICERPLVLASKGQYNKYTFTVYDKEYSCY